MNIYTHRKSEIDTLARTFQNLNQNENFSKLNKSTKLSPRPMKKYSGGIGNVNGYSKMGSKNKDISSRFKFTTMSMKTKGIIPANISNVNRSIHKKRIKTTSSHNESYTSNKYKKYGKLNKNRSSQRYDLNKSLQRYKLGCSYPKHERANSQQKDSSSLSKSLSIQDSRNDNFGKSKSINQDHSKIIKFETRNINEPYSKFYE